MQDALINPDVHLVFTQTLARISGGEADRSFATVIRSAQRAPSVRPAGTLPDLEFAAAVAVAVLDVDARVRLRIDQIPYGRSTTDPLWMDKQS
jgi:hypothetical protein